MYRLPASCLGVLLVVLSSSHLTQCMRVRDDFDYEKCIKVGRRSTPHAFNLAWSTRYTVDSRGKVF